MQSTDYWLYRANVVEIVNNSKLPFEKKAKRLSKVLSVLPPFETEEGRSLLTDLETSSTRGTFEENLDTIYTYCDYVRVCLS